MKPTAILDRAVREGRLNLSEDESKKLLSHYGVPVVKDKIVMSASEAVLCSQKIGFPVVAKGHGTKLTHKTEQGLVKVNLKSATEVRNAFRTIQQAAGADWEGCLIQPMVEGKREFVAGLIRDAQFGPVVMFGLGGIFTEALADTTFRIAPFSAIQARQMIDELSSSKILSNFRGEAAAQKDQLVAVLLGLSSLGLEQPGIKEIDINPLIITPKGKVIAVDALVVLSEKQTPAEKMTPSINKVKEINAALDVMTYPRSLAVIGATRNNSQGFPGMFACIKDFGFPGELYPINPHADEILGHKAYPNLVAIDKPIDLVVISVPAPYVPSALRDCVASGSKNVHIFSSGFKETGEAEGIRLQEEIGKIAQEGGLNVIGPNCMGLYVPESRILTWIGASDKSGPVAFISQSGGNATDYTHYASERLGVHFSKVFSYGNALTLDSTDFLEYLAQDDKTQIITMYLEGVKDGRRLLDLVTQINKTKPVIILKAGLSESGARAVASHTGSLAGGEKIWNAFFRQSGAIRVESLEEMAEVAMAFLHLGISTGKGVAVIGTGGGVGVAAADSCAKVGMELPALPEKLMTKLREFIPPAGNMIRNPVDAHIVLLEPELLGKTLDMLSAESYLDMFIISLHMDWLFSRGQGASTEKIAVYLAKEARQHTKGKPLVVAWRQFQPNPLIRKTLENVEEVLKSASIPLYEGIPRAMFALAKLAEYHAFKRNNTQN